MRTNCPWEDCTQGQGAYHRAPFLLIANGLNRRVPKDRKRAKYIAAFVDSKPPMKTERHELQEKLAGRLQRALVHLGREESKELDSQDER